MNNLKDDEFFMKEALKQAKKAFLKGEIPVGAVVVYDNKIIGRGYNKREKTNDPTAHAEIIALRKAVKKIGDWRLNEATLYVTLEPCIMCLGAILLSRVKKIVYAVSDFDNGALGGRDDIDLRGRPIFGYVVEEIKNVALEEEAKKLLQDFFKEIRNKKKLNNNS